MLLEEPLVPEEPELVLGELEPVSEEPELDELDEDDDESDEELEDPAVAGEAAPVVLRLSLR